MKSVLIGSGFVGSARFWLSGSGSAKYTDPRIWIQGAKYQPKTAKRKFYSQNPSLNRCKKRDSVNLKEMLWFGSGSIFSSADTGSGSASKLNEF